MVNLIVGKEQQNYEIFRTIDGSERIKSDEDGQGVAQEHTSPNRGGETGVLRGI